MNYELWIMNYQMRIMSEISPAAQHSFVCKEYNYEVKLWAHYEIMKL